MLAREVNTSFDASCDPDAADELSRRRRAVTAPGPRVVHPRVRRAAFRVVGNTGVNRGEVLSREGDAGRFVKAGQTKLTFVLVAMILLLS